MSDLIGCMYPIHARESGTELILRDMLDINKRIVFHLLLCFLIARRDWGDAG